jgi:hypothetical protein
MEDLCKQNVEYGLHVHVLEKDEQTGEAGEAKIHSNVLQP